MHSLKGEYVLPFLTVCIKRRRIEEREESRRKK